MPSQREDLKAQAPFSRPKLGVKNGLIFFLTVLCLLFYSCATVKIILKEGATEERTAEEKEAEEKTKTLKDRYSRTYSMDFSSFHPKMNSALQEYAQKHKGNSFRVVRLGSDGVMIKGYFRSEKNGERFSAEISVKPGVEKVTRLEIKLSAPALKMEAGFLERACRELFQIIEQGTGVAPGG